MSQSIIASLDSLHPLFALVALLQRYKLRKLLGKFNLYNKLVENIKKISLFHIK